ncbi:hypothetical protein AY599_08595 [Leptolyngbya valderiana BDU 20041]|nr:hypothetical protein AY599_08595 [Leptolyngbya valderiana BDU 20041]
MRLTGRTITDDRGTRRPITRWVYSFTYPMPWEPIYRETPRSWRMYHLGALIFALVVVALIVLSSFIFPSLGSPLAALPSLWMPAFMIVWMGVFCYFHFAVFKPWAKRHKLAAGRCRACGYDLSNLTADPDGCTTCPECGAAWKLPPPTPQT